MHTCQCSVRDSQKGAGNLKAIVWTGILIAFIYVCIQVIPHYVDDYQFRDTMSTEARFASVKHESPEDIRANLFKEAQKADMPLTLQDIKVVRQENWCRSSLLS